MCLSPITITKNKNTKEEETIQVRCGKCIECNIQRIKEWTNRLYLEQISHDESCFITLTFSNDLITNNTDKEVNPLMAIDLKYSKRYFQLFLKRLRKYIYKTENKFIKYYHIGEYGSRNQRAHHHIIIFGWKPKDMRQMEVSKSGKEQFFSQTINDIWKLGRISVQNTNINNIKYICKYTTEKINNTNRYNTNFAKPYQTFSNRGELGDLMLYKNAVNLIDNNGFTLDGQKFTLSTRQIKKIIDFNKNDYSHTKESKVLIEKCELLLQERILKVEERQNRENQQIPNKEYKTMSKEIIYNNKKINGARYK